MSHNPAAPARQPIVIWFGRVGDMILLSTLLDILHRRYGSPCRLVGAGAFTTEIYRTHRDVSQVNCIRRYTPFLFDLAWWRALRALRRNRTDPVYVCETDPRKLTRIRRLLTLSGTDPAPLPVHHRGGELSRSALGRPTGELRAPDTSGVARERLSVADDASSAVRAASRSVGRGTRGLRRVGRRARVGRADHSSWCSRVIGARCAEASSSVSPLDDKAWPIERWAELLRSVHCAYARSGDRVMWRATGDAVAGLDTRGRESAEGGVRRRVADGAVTRVVRVGAQHDLRRHRARSRRRGAGPAARGAVWRPAAGAVAAAKLVGLAGHRYRRPAECPSGWTRSR